jgi:hypothetical protein
VRTDSIYPNQFLILKAIISTTCSYNKGTL